MTKLNLKRIKTVHFVYDYSLCQNTPNSTAGGKLTLKKLFFTYQNSDKGAYNSYDFSYSAINPSYDINNYDRWGNYKSTEVVSDAGCTASKPPKDIFPYSNQDKNIANSDARAWQLTKIKLPSDG